VLPGKRILKGLFDLPKSSFGKHAFVIGIISSPMLQQCPPVF
jgi:hypothetical protein